MIGKGRKKKIGLRCSFEKVWFLLLMPDIIFDDRTKVKTLNAMK